MAAGFDIKPGTSPIVASHAYDARPFSGKMAEKLLEKGIYVLILLPSGAKKTGRIESIFQQDIGSKLISIKQLAAFIEGGKDLE